MATEIQESALPRVFPPFPERTEFELYASMTPAKEVGGDFYDFFLIAIYRYDAEVYTACIGILASHPEIGNKKPPEGEGFRKQKAVRAVSIIGGPRNAEAGRPRGIIRRGNEKGRPSVPFE